MSAPLKKWAISRMESVTRNRGQGQPTKLTGKHIQAIEEWMGHDPTAYGYKQTTWTCKLLADLLQNKFILKITPERTTAPCSLKCSRRLWAKALQESLSRKNRRLASVGSFHLLVKMPADRENLSRVLEP